MSKINALPDVGRQTTKRFYNCIKTCTMSTLLEGEPTNKGTAIQTAAYSHIVLSPKLATKLFAGNLFTWKARINDQFTGKI